MSDLCQSKMQYLQHNLYGENDHINFEYEVKEIVNGHNLFICKSQLHDICLLKNSLRTEDRIEIWSSSNHTPEKALLTGYLYSSLCWTTYYKGMPIMMWGVVGNNDFPGMGNVWLLGSPEIFEIKKTFIKYSKVYVNRMLDTYPTLYNWVDSRYKKAIKWLELLGAELSPEQHFGVEQDNFNYFVIKKRGY